MMRNNPTLNVHKFLLKQLQHFTDSPYLTNGIIPNVTGVQTKILLVKSLMHATIQYHASAHGSYIGSMHGCICRTVKLHVCICCYHEKPLATSIAECLCLHGCMQATKCAYICMQANVCMHVVVIQSECTVQMFWHLVCPPCMAHTRLITTHCMQLQCMHARTYCSCCILVCCI